LFRNGRTIELDLPLSQLKRTVSLAGKELSLDSSSGQGKIKVSLTIPSLYRNCYAYFWELSADLFGTTSGTKIFVMLYDDCLHCYSGPYGSQSRSIRKINCKSIIDFSEEKYDRMEIQLDAIKIVCADSSTNILQLQQQEYFWASTGDNPNTLKMWNRLLASYVRQNKLCRL